MFRTSKPYYVTMLAAFGVMLLCIVLSFVLGAKTDTKDIDKQTEEIRVLENEIATKSAAISANNKRAVDSSLGIDTSRVEKDDEAARALLRTMTTWNNYAEYCAARDKMMNEYNISAGSAVMQVFFPEYGEVTNPDYSTTNIIDAYQLSCSYKGMKSMTCGVDSASGVYRYFTIVTCLGNRGGTGSSFNLAVLYSVDANGNISNFDAYTLDGYKFN